MVDLPFGFYLFCDNRYQHHCSQKVENPPGYLLWVGSVLFEAVLLRFAHPHTRAWLQQQQSGAFVLGVIVIEYFVPRPAQEASMKQVGPIAV